MEGGNYCWACLGPVTPSTGTLSCLCLVATGATDATNATARDSSPDDIFYECFKTVPPATGFLCFPCVEKLLAAHRFYLSCKAAGEAILKHLREGIPLEECKDTVTVKREPGDLEDPVSVHLRSNAPDADDGFFDRRVSNHRALSQPTAKRRVRRRQVFGSDREPKANEPDEDSDRDRFSDRSATIERFSEPETDGAFGEIKEEPFRNSAYPEVPVECLVTVKSDDEEKPLILLKTDTAGAATKRRGRPKRMRGTEFSKTRRREPGAIRRTTPKKSPAPSSGEPKTIREKSVFCPTCGKGFTTAKYMEMHARTHDEEPAHSCDICSKSFHSKYHLREHFKWHSAERPYLCSECGQRFIRNDYLVIHMRRHTGEKPYKCKFCQKGFPRMTDLTVHERYHTGEKTHLCTICGKGFQRQYNLNVHLRVHTGEKPYACTYCGRRFAQGNDLKSHVRRHTGERYNCEVCGEGFIQGYHLTQHRKAAHGLQGEAPARRLAKHPPPKETDARSKPKTPPKRVNGSTTPPQISIVKVESIAEKLTTNAPRSGSTVRESATPTANEREADEPEEKFQSTT